MSPVTLGHTLCFRESVSGIHREVNENELSIWVDALCEVEATLTHPPDNLRFTSSSSAQRNFSDQKSIISTSSRTWAASSLSFGVPGPGYYSGKGLKWLGAKALISVNALVMWTQVSSEVSKLKAWKSSSKIPDSMDYMGLLNIVFNLTEYLR
ncbi:hypothetical protein M422DRAFT_784112 [Sphaerobolus stellatus SS14]|uniref:Uncharacterized protein n=1 Tax=Sphaerobolus stellatus (strain SS14) TaxID=990650 RepID=A0A0C9UYA6_SPHS4|nr:hypothetical protein M422DRAFT_784112 [Sphaerobolus stellatus SS14]